MAEHVTQKTPDLLRYSAQISGLCSDEQPWKTALEATNHSKTLTVLEALLDRENVQL